MRPVRVLLVIGTAHLGGAEGQLVRLAIELRKRAIDARVLFLTRGGPHTKRLDEKGVPWSCLRPAGLPRSSTIRSLVAVIRLGWRLVRWQPDIVFAWLAAVIVVTLPLAAVLTRARRIAAFRGEVYDSDLRWTARLFRFSVRHAHAVTINAPSLYNEAVRWGALPERITMIGNGVDIPPKPADVEVTPPAAVVVANFRPYKGHDDLIDALALVRAPIVVRLLGDGASRDRVRERAEALGVENRLEFLDPPADVPKELKQAQFAIHTSHTEGLSNAILEELAAGLPVVATDVGGTSLLVEDGRNGFLVPPSDPQALAARISDVASSAKLRSAMSAEARTRAGQFDWDSCVSSYRALFSDLTGRSV